MQFNNKISQTPQLVQCKALSVLEKRNIEKKNVTINAKKEE